MSECMVICLRKIKMNKVLPFDENCWDCEFCKKGIDDKQPMCYNIKCNEEKENRFRYEGTDYETFCGAWL